MQTEENTIQSRLRTNRRQPSVSPNDITQKMLDTQQPSQESSTWQSSRPQIRNGKATENIKNKFNNMQNANHSSLNSTQRDQENRTSRPRIEDNKMLLTNSGIDAT